MVSVHELIPRVSVVMTTYNVQEFVEEAVDSILAQSFEEFELIIVDDGSTDETREILYEYGDPRIMLLPGQHVGIPRARNKGLARAAGEFIALQDGDDASTPDRIERQVTFLEENPEIGLTGTFSDVIDLDSEDMGNRRFPVEHEKILEVLENQFCFQHGSVMWRRELGEVVGGYRKEFPVAEDYDFIFRFAQRYRVTNMPDVLYLYRRGSASSTFRAEKVLNLYCKIAQELAAQRRESGGFDCLMHDSRIETYAGILGLERE